MKTKFAYKTDSASVYVYKQFAWLPTRMADYSWKWLTHYYRSFHISRNMYLDHNGRFQSRFQEVYNITPKQLTRELLKYSNEY